MDVDKVNIDLAVFDEGPTPTLEKRIPNDPHKIAKQMESLQREGWELRTCYEAGPCGYELKRCLDHLEIPCAVVAPGLVPQRPSDHVKTNRRDALKLARSYRAGDLTAVWVPDAAHEALRDLVRAREAAKKDQLRARHRLGKFLLRHGRRPSTTMNTWTQRHLKWVKTVPE
jgi:transposase